ncbi:hypothetical protein [Dankookia sp. P2]|uniref:hypothetical protein n=1 Tax=Dankookia sp. P2 TaxID=3423955 RepID=UPI003D6736E3
MAAQKVGYLYFIDEISLPQCLLLEALVRRGLQFGIVTSIDLWRPEMLDQPGQDGCVSIEAGAEALTPEGRAARDKNCRISTDDLAERLLYAKRRVPFVQANLIKVAGDDAVPLHAYLSSPDYHPFRGMPDDQAWKRAHEYYLGQFDSLSGIKEDGVASLQVFRSDCCR